MDTPAGGGDSFPNDGYTCLLITNGSGAPITVTFADGPGAVSPEGAVAFNADVAVAVPAGASRLVGPFTDKARFNDVNGRVVVTYSGITSLTVKAIRMG
jgi:hypothetical protein